MKNQILAIDYDWYSTKEGEFYQRSEVGLEGRNGLCVDISKTKEGSYMILFDDGRTYETFNPSTVYRVPLTHDMLKTDVQ